MKIGIVGAGIVGSSLARAVLRVGHQVMLSSRNPDSERMTMLITDLGPDASAGTVAQTLAFGDVIALALRWDSIADAVQQGAWSGKVVIDMTNRFGSASSTSAAQDLASMTGARVVKAFNTIGAGHYVHPDFAGQTASMFIAGDDTEAKAMVGELVSQLGFDLIDAGDLAAAAHLEALAAFWVHLARTVPQGRAIAFKLLRG